MLPKKSISSQVLVIILLTLLSTSSIAQQGALQSIPVVKVGVSIESDTAIRLLGVSQRQLTEISLAEELQKLLIKVYGSQAWFGIELASQNESITNGVRLTVTGSCDNAVALPKLGLVIYINGQSIEETLDDRAKQLRNTACADPHVRYDSSKYREAIEEEFERAKKAITKNLFKNHIPSSVPIAIGSSAIQPQLNTKNVELMVEYSQQDLNRLANRIFLVEFESQSKPQAPAGEFEIANLRRNSSRTYHYGAKVRSWTWRQPMPSGSPRQFREFTDREIQCLTNSKDVVVTVVLNDFTN